MHRIAVALAVVSLALLATSAAAVAKPVHLRGTAYEFNNVDTLLRGATIRVAEYPRLRARTKADGTYNLAVPDHARVTPYIVAAGYNTVYLQTFRTNGEDLRRVNFQTPTNGIYRALAALLSVPLDADGEIRRCAIVSTFSTRNVRDLGFVQFTGYGAHGVAGATAFATPALPAPIYFNDDVIPDPAQPLSSIDGGVIWTGVPTGVYRLRARRPSTRFASFVATCRPGRVINANPPWGFHELGLAMPATLTTRWVGVGGEAQLRRLRVSKLPPGARVRISCAGPDCSFRRRTVSTPGGGKLDVLDALGLAPPFLRARQHIDVLVTAHAYDGKLIRWRLRRTGRLHWSTLCVPLGNTKPRRC